MPLFLLPFLFISDFITEDSNNHVEMRDSYKSYSYSSPKIKAKHDKHKQKNGKVKLSYNDEGTIHLQPSRQRTQGKKNVFGKCSVL